MEPKLQHIFGVFLRHNSIMPQTPFLLIAGGLLQHKGVPHPK